MKDLHFTSLLVFMATSFSLANKIAKLVEYDKAQGQFTVLY
jgi:hypothetical protein